MSDDKVVSLEKLFPNRLFQVPDYQRGYSWEKQQIEEFLEDLELLKPGRHHYTGTVVLQESHSERMDEEGGSYVLAEVIDGQQRLTTIVLLLDGIRRSLAQFSKTSNKTLSDGIKKTYIAAQERNGQPLYKISLNRDTDDFFKGVILSDHPRSEGPKITSQQRLAGAKKQIKTYLDHKTSMTPDEREEWLVNLFSKLRSQLRFTLYLVGSDAEAGVIFETMNDRGRPLSELEKVKNYLLHASFTLHTPPETNELAQSINMAWSKILHQLMAAGLVSSANENQLLQNDWLTRYNPTSGHWNGSKSVKGEFSLKGYEEKRKDLLEDLRRYTEGLRESCIGFCDAHRPNRLDAFGSFEANSEIRNQVIEWSLKLVRIDLVAIFLPLLLAVRKRWPDDPAKYLEILKLCEAYAFRVYRLAGYKYGTGGAQLFRLGYELATEKVKFPETVLGVKHVLASWCGKDGFKRLTTPKPEDPYDWYAWRGLLRYFLYEYEIYLTSEKGGSPKLGWEEFAHNKPETIEHILPQTIDGQPYWQGNFTPEQHEQYVHDLGNLTLTKHNSFYQNKSFPDKKGEAGAKKPCYAESLLEVEKDLIHWEHWDKDAIIERRTQLLNWARKRWAVPGIDEQQH